jgi:hypothetical protein
MTGKHVSLQQVLTYQSAKQTMTQAMAAKISQISVSTANRIDNGFCDPSNRRKRRTPQSLLSLFWFQYCVPIVQKNPTLNAVQLHKLLSSQYPEQMQSMHLRSLQRRVRQLRPSHAVAPDAQDRSPASLNEESNDAEMVFRFLRLAHQGVLRICDLPERAQAHESISDILKFCRSGTLTKRNKALLALSVLCGLSLRCLAKYPVSSAASLYRWKSIFLTSGFCTLIETPLRTKLRFKDSDLAGAIFKILHEPPALHGFPRTNWHQPDLKITLARKGVYVSL